MDSFGSKIAGKREESWLLEILFVQNAAYFT